MSAPAPDRARHRGRRPRRLGLRRRARAASGFRRIHRLKLLTALLLTAALSVGLLLLSVVLATADAGFERERLDGRLRRQVAAARALLVAEPGDPAEPSDVARLAADDGLAGGYPQLYVATGRRRSGSGLGLAIAGWVARIHGGQLTAANRRAADAGGAEFTLELPE
jgi:hypothetical protein